VMTLSNLQQRSVPEFNLHKVGKWATLSTGGGYLVDTYTGSPNCTAGDTIPSICSDHMGEAGEWGTCDETYWTEFGCDFGLDGYTCDSVYCFASYWQYSAGAPNAKGWDIQAPYASNNVGVKDPAPQCYPNPCEFNNLPKPAYEMVIVDDYGVVPVNKTLATAFATPSAFAGSCKINNTLYSGARCGYTLDGYTCADTLCFASYWQTNVNHSRSTFYAPWLDHGGGQAHGPNENATVNGTLECLPNSCDYDRINYIDGVVNKPQSFTDDDGLTVITQPVVLPMDPAGSGHCKPCTNKTTGNPTDSKCLNQLEHTFETSTGWVPSGYNCSFGAMGWMCGHWPGNCTTYHGPTVAGKQGTGYQIWHCGNPTCYAEKWHGTDITCTPNACNYEELEVPPDSRSIYLDKGCQDGGSILTNEICEWRYTGNAGPLGEDGYTCDIAKCYAGRWNAYKFGCYPNPCAFDSITVPEGATAFGDGCVSGMLVQDGGACEFKREGGYSYQKALCKAGIWTTTAPRTLHSPDGNGVTVSTYSVSSTLKLGGLSAAQFDTTTVKQAFQTSISAMMSRVLSSTVYSSDVSFSSITDARRDAAASISYSVSTGETQPSDSQLESFSSSCEDSSSTGLSARFNTALTSAGVTDISATEVAVTAQPTAVTTSETASDPCVDEICTGTDPSGGGHQQNFTSIAILGAFGILIALLLFIGAIVLMVQDCQAHRHYIDTDDLGKMGGMELDVVDDMSTVPGVTSGGESGDVAVDAELEEDLDMQEPGVEDQPIEGQI